MPLTDFQKSVLRIIKPFRSELSYVGGGAALNKSWARISDDMDVFEDHRQRLPRNVDQELVALRDRGYTIELTTEDEWMVEAIVRKYGFETRIQWMDDAETSRRFFPAIDDDELGFRLHQADAAVNKVLCAARRTTAARDAVDLVSIVQEYAPLGPLVWAVAGKDDALTPPKTIQSIRNNTFGYADEEIRAVRIEGENATRDIVRAVLEPALQRASVYCLDEAPQDRLGELFIDADEKPIEADGDALEGGTATSIKIKDFGVTPTLIT